VAIGKIRPGVYSKNGKNTTLYPPTKRAKRGEVKQANHKGEREESVKSRVLITTTETNVLAKFSLQHNEF